MAPLYGAFLRPRSPSRRAPERLLRRRSVEADEVSVGPAATTAPVAADPGLAYIFDHTRDKKCLVFVNSREEAETVTATLRQYCEAVGEPDRFLIHHGNLSASLPRDGGGGSCATTSRRLYHRDDGHPRARYRHRSPRARLPDRRPLYRLVVSPAHGPHGPARRPSRDVVRHARGRAGAAHHASRDRAVEAPPGHSPRAALP